MTIGYVVPDALVRRLESNASVAGSAGIGARRYIAQKGRLLGFSAKVLVAGTAAGHSANLRKISGTTTTTVATITLGTSAAGVTGTAAVSEANKPLAAHDTIEVFNGTDATGTYMWYYEYTVDHDATPVGGV